MSSRQIVTMHEIDINSKKFPLSICSFLLLVECPLTAIDWFDKFIIYSLFQHANVF